MNRQIYKDIPPQELKEKWFKSHLLGKEVELRELYELLQTMTLAEIGVLTVSATTALNPSLQDGPKIDFNKAEGMRQ